MSPLVPDFLHEPGINALNNMKEHKVKHGGRQFFVFLHFGIILIFELVILLVQVVNDMVVDFLVEFGGRLSLDIFDLVKLKKMNAFLPYVIDQLDHEPDIIKASRTVYNIIMIILVNLSSNDTKHG